jgi:hypothetical protein
VPNFGTDFFFNVFAKQTNLPILFQIRLRFHCFPCLSTWIISRRLLELLSGHARSERLFRWFFFRTFRTDTAVPRHESFATLLPGRCDFFIFSSSAFSFALHSLPQTSFVHHLSKGKRTPFHSRPTEMRPTSGKFKYEAAPWYRRDDIVTALALVAVGCLWLWYRSTRPAAPTAGGRASAAAAAATAAAGGRASAAGAAGGISSRQLTGNEDLLSILRGKGHTHWEMILYTHDTNALFDHTQADAIRDFSQCPNAMLVHRLSEDVPSASQPQPAAAAASGATAAVSAEEASVVAQVRSVVDAASFGRSRLVLCTTAPGCEAVARQVTPALLISGDRALVEKMIRFIPFAVHVDPAAAGVTSEPVEGGKKKIYTTPSVSALFA